MDLSNRHYSKQSHMLVNPKYALTKNEIDLILTLLTEIKEDTKIFKIMFLPSKIQNLNPLTNGTLSS